MILYVNSVFNMGQTTNTREIPLLFSSKLFLLQKSAKVFPRESSVWCQDIESGHQMPRIVKTKPKILKKASNVLVSVFSS